MKTSIFLACLTATLWAGMSFAQSPASDTNSANPCISTNPNLGDSAFWAGTAVEQFADKQFSDSVSTVDACFIQWGPDAGQQQKKFNDEKTSCPSTGKVNRANKQKIEKNYLINDVSMALWAKARSLHELGQIELAKKAYFQCIYMTCGRVWDPNGWYWSPAEDCVNNARKLLESDQ